MPQVTLGTGVRDAYRRGLFDLVGESYDLRLFTMLMLFGWVFERRFDPVVRNFFSRSDILDRFGDEDPWMTTRASGQ